MNLENQQYRKRSIFFGISLGLFIFILDFITKYATQKYLPLLSHHGFTYPYGGIGVFKDFLGIEFSINHQINRGAAWGIFSEFQIPLLYLRIALIFGLFFYTFFVKKKPYWNIPLCMILAGAIGNVLDFYLYGHVVDMLHFVLFGYDFPVFNIADSAIFLGIVIMIWLSSKEPNLNSELGC